MGDELRVTVIATGISSIEEAETISELNVVGRSKNETAGTSIQVVDEPASQKENRAVSFAPPNPVPKGLRTMPTPIFDEHNEMDEWDEPAYIRKKAN